MGLFRFSWVFMFCWGVWFLRFGVVYSQTELTVKFLKAPRLFSHLNTATFKFESVCTDCSFICKLDGGSGADCEGRKVFLRSLLDGSHTFEVCANGSRGVACASHNWTVDTVPPTAKITSSTSFTNALNVSVNISFSEPCAGGGGFACSSADSCNLLVYGPGKVKPESFTVVKANLTYSLVVELATNVIYGRVILVMDKNFCTDNAGNRFTRTVNSSFFLHFDRRSVFLDVRTHIQEKLLQLNNSTRTVLATNDNNNLKVYLYFSQPILNSSTDILNSLNASQGTLVPISGENLGNRKFGFEIVNISDISIITVGVHSISILSRPGTPVTPTAPVTFLYDSQRVAVRLSTTSSRRTTDQSVPISIKFMKPVFGFNSSFISISGGHLRSFHEISRSKYTAEIHPTNEFISVSIPQNVTWDVAGNKNLPSNVLHVRHYSVPTISSVISIFATACFAATASVAGILSVSTATLQSTGALSRPTTMLTTEPTRNLFRFACYIQVFALSRWLPVMQPVEYYELARGLRWSIPYFSLPWENRGTPAIMVGMNYSIGSHSYTSDPRALRIPKSMQRDGEGSNVNAALYGLPLTPMEYGMFFESENMKPQAEFIQDTQHSNGWRDFYRSMFWLAVISGSLILLHMFFLFILKIKKYPQKQKGYGVLTFPRFEIFLIILALPCVCESASALVGGGMPSGVVVGALLLGVVGFVLLTLLLFLSIGITLGKLLQYKEVHQVGQTFHWYQELIRVTLGPGKKGQWTWKDQPNSVNLIMFGPLFEDLRGPPKYMLSQIYGNNPRKQGDSIIASDDETEDAEAPFIQKLFGILRIYYTLLDLLKRVTLGIVAGAYLDNWSCRTPTIILLAMTSFQLFFIVLKKPFIKKKVQLVEIISLTCQDAVFATCFVLLRKEFSDTDETKLGIFMMLLFLLGFLAHLITEWYSLYKQIRRLDPDEKSISTGLKTASIGFLMMFTPLKTTENLKKKLPLPQSQQEGLQPEAQAAAVAAAALTRNRSLGSTDKPWLKQLREMAKASFTREGNRGQSDPSTSTAKRSGFWSKKSGSPSGNSSSDFKSKPNQLYRDLEAIFSSK